MAKYDFNPHGNEDPLETNIFEDDMQSLMDSDSSEIAFLSLNKGDMVIITLMPNNSGWFEGYKASDETCSLGIWHLYFIHLVEF